jgi:hypothetical protein
MSTTITRPDDSPLCVSACAECAARWFPRREADAVPGRGGFMTVICWAHHADLELHGFEIFASEDEDDDAPDCLCPHMYTEEDE